MQCRAARAEQNSLDALLHRAATALHCDTTRDVTLRAVDASRRHVDADLRSEIGPSRSPAPIFARLR
eukprot:6196653-Pleurochrysis_carterae.AAC.3